MLRTIMKFLSFLLVACLAVACNSVTHAPMALAAEHPEFRAYDPAPETPAQTQVEQALSTAAETGKHTIIVMGANWCHDSRALAGWFQTPRFETLLSQNYVVRYVDVGQKDVNIDIAQGFGLDEIVGTPTVIVTDSAGVVLNLETAPTWRNAASREEDAIFEYFAEFVPKLNGD